MKTSYKFNVKRQTEDKRDWALKFELMEGIRLPRKLDLRPLMPDMYDQLQLGACGSNALCEDDKYYKKDFDPSRLYNYYKTRELMGTINEDSGVDNRDLLKSANQSGICTESLYPYDITKFTEKPSAEADVDAQSHKLKAYSAIQAEKQQLIKSIKTSLVMKHPVLTGMDVFATFAYDDYVAQTGLMRMPDAGEPVMGGHDVIMAGYWNYNIFDKLRLWFNHLPIYSGVFICGTSWGKNWGDHGYFFMPYEFVLAGHIWDSWIPLF
jgi:C1A family cysteine protease